ncbi:NAD(P)-binding protein, partial [Aureobasidium melanogenum]
MFKLRTKLPFPRTIRRTRCWTPTATISSSSPRRAGSQLHDGDLRSVRPMFDLKDRNYIITGGGRGIGYAITRAIAEMGGNVAVLDILDTPVKDFGTLEGDLGVKARYFHADVTNEHSLTQGFEQSIAEFGSLDGCVTAAGIALDKPFVEQTWKEVSRVQDVNVTGTFFAAQLATKQMEKQGTGGSLVLIASVCAHCAIPGHRLSGYHASKGAVKMLSTALSVELAPQGIRCNTISPGYIESEMTKSLREQHPHLVRLMHTAPPLKRIGNRNDLTGAAIYLLSDAAAYTTGADIAITGGLHAGRIEA